MKFYFCKLFLAVQFPARPPQKIWERLSGMAVPTRKASLAGLLLALTRQAASALLELSSSTLSSWRSLRWQPDWAPHWLGARALAPLACSWSLQGHKPNSAASSTSGSLKSVFAINDCHAEIRWLVLGGRWKACSRPHKIGQFPTRRFSKTLPLLVGVLACLEGSLLAFLQSPCRSWVMNS